jgi:PKD repeat protein
VLLPPDCRPCDSWFFRPSRHPSAWILAGLLISIACSGGTDLLLPGDGEPAHIELEEGAQSGRVGEALAQPLVFSVTDSRARPVEDARIIFDLGSAGPEAAVVPDTAISDANGMAEVTLVLGTRVGPQVIEARVLVAEGAEEPKTSVTIMALSENANGISAVSGDDQTAPAGSTLGQALVVQVTDAFGNPISGVPIIWTAPDGGSVSETSNVTDGDGRASVVRTLGPTAGTQTTLAASEEPLAGSPVTFTHTATAGSVAGLSIVSGNEQTAEAGTELPGDLVVRLVDAAGNGVPGAAVTWVVGLGGGTVAPENTTTDEAGRTSTRWTLGPSPGENRVDAVVSGVGVANFRATGTASGPVPTTTTITSDSPDPSIAGGTVTVGFRVSSERLTPTGSVTVTALDGGANCTGSLQGGAGSCQMVLNQAGDRTLRAVYSGSPGFNGSSDTEGHRVNPAAPDNRPPDADYNWHCEGLSCDFTDGSRDPDGEVTRWSWNFGDGSPTVTQQNPTHTYAGPGRYTVTLTATDNDGASDVSSATVEVEAPPPPPPGGTSTSITGDNPDPSAPGQAITVSFSVISSSGTPTGVVRVEDAQGGGCTGSAPSGSCSYTPNGTGTRTITATYDGNASFNGSSASAQHTVSAPPPPPNQAPVAAFTWDCDDLECDFDNNSNDPDGSIQASSWDFGDGTTSNEFDPDHSYSSGGTYTVTLTVTDDDGATSTVPHQITVTDPNQPPTAQFTWSCEFLECDFEDVSIDDDGIDSRSWNFGDPGSGEENTSDNNNPDHTFTAPGTYTVRLTVTDDNGNADVADSTITVNAPPNEPPTAVIGSISCNGMNCQFDDDSTDPNGAETIAEWNWIFGDGGSSIDRNPSHVYRIQGPYAVTLTVKDNRGVSSLNTDQETVTVPVLGGDGDDDEDDLVTRGDPT